MNYPVDWRSLHISSWTALMDIFRRRKASIQTANLVVIRALGCFIPISSENFFLHSLHLYRWYSTCASCRNPNHMGISSNIVLARSLTSTFPPQYGHRTVSVHRVLLCHVMTPVSVSSFSVIVIPSLSKIMIGKRTKKGR